VIYNVYNEGIDQDLNVAVEIEAKFRVPDPKTLRQLQMLDQLHSVARRRKAQLGYLS